MDKRCGLLRTLCAGGVCRTLRAGRIEVTHSQLKPDRPDVDGRPAQRVFTQLAEASLRPEIALLAATLIAGCFRQTPATPASPSRVVLTPRQGIPVGVVQGLVVADDTQHVPGSALIELIDLHLRTYANQLGAFQFSDLPSGEHQLLVRRIGYNPVAATIVVPLGGYGAAVRIVLTTSRLCLDYCEPSPPPPPGRVENAP